MSNAEEIRQSVAKVRDLMSAILDSDHAEMDRAVAAITGVETARVMKLSSHLYWAYEELQSALQNAQDDEEPGRADLRRMEMDVRLDRMSELEATAETVIRPQYLDGQLVSIQINSAGHTFDPLEASVIQLRISGLLAGGILRARGEGDD
jgi:hypothetical protein